MRLFRQLRALFRKGKLDAEMSEELRVHVEFQTRENIARGMSPDEARYAAQRSFGGVEQIKERCRDQPARLRRSDSNPTHPGGISFSCGKKRAETNSL